LTPQPLAAQPEGGDAEERRWQGSKKEQAQLYYGNPTNNFNLQEYLITRTQSFQFIVRGAVTVRRTLESTMGKSITAETPVYR
jgi:hypothetical protein